MLTVLFCASISNALIYAPQDWQKNPGALTLDDTKAPFAPNCIVAFCDGNHNNYRTATVIAPNFVLSCKHWRLSKGCRIKRIGNKHYYREKSPKYDAKYREIYIVSDKREINGADIIIYRIKKAINSKNPNTPTPDIGGRPNYDWINDPNGYFEDANLTSYMPLYTGTDELNKDIIIAGFGPQRVAGLHEAFTNGSHAVAPGTLHWGYNQITSAGNSSIRMKNSLHKEGAKAANEIGAGRRDSGTGWYIKDESDGKYKLVTTFHGPTSGPRISRYIDEIAKKVAEMGTPTPADKKLADLKQKPLASSEPKKQNIP